MRQLRQEQSVTLASNFFSMLISHDVIKTYSCNLIPNPVNKTTPLLRPKYFGPMVVVKMRQEQSVTLASNFFSMLISHDVIKTYSCNLIPNPVNNTTPLLRPKYFGPMVVVLTGSTVPAIRYPRFLDNQLVLSPVADLA